MSLRLPAQCLKAKSRTPSELQALWNSIKRRLLRIRHRSLCASRVPPHPLLRPTTPSRTPRLPAQCLKAKSRTPSESQALRNSIKRRLLRICHRSLCASRVPPHPLLRLTRPSRTPRLPAQCLQASSRTPSESHIMRRLLRILHRSLCASRVPPHPLLRRKVIHAMAISTIRSAGG